jgi:formylglycine-generating enzyme required for sulfatase activity
VCITQGYWLDTYEVTNAAYQKFIDAGGYSKRDYWSADGWASDGWLWLLGQVTKAPSDYTGFTDAQQPRVGISWYEAEAYAKWRGGRLPTEAEWEYAARGPQSLIYPWGNTWDSSKANIENKVERTTAVGSYPLGKSWIGAYDLAGNVWEWTADWYDGNYYQQKLQNDPQGPTDGGRRVLRGGSFSHAQNFARAAYRDHASPERRQTNYGFRVVAAAP